MKKIAWITDSASGLSQAFIKEHNIHVVPLQLIVNHETYREGIDITNDEFYNILKEHGEGAKTSQPALGEFVDLYNKLKEEYEIGIALHASSELTGTYQTSLMASKITGFDIEAIDSKMGAYVLGKLVQYAMSLEKKGKSVEEIVKAVEKMSKRAEMFLLPASFTQMKNSGRVSTSQALIANLLNINIVLGFDDGKVVVEEKIRGKKKVERYFKNLYNEAIEKYQLDEICIMHAGALEKAQQWKDELKETYDDLQVVIQTLVPVAGVHAGFGTMAVSWIGNK
ncbi:MAG TPA: DegV family protein [Pseudogracilibacillus sp.]|nr:DegV family protein [Pseudogracilibacillus sp.]